jgi:hypothetical protein
VTTNKFEKLKMESQSGVSFRKVQLCFLRDFNWSAIEKLYDLVASHLSNSPEQRMLQYSTDEFDVETKQGIYEEECGYSNELKNLAAEMIIVALYKKVEIDTKQAIKVTFPLENTRNLYLFKNLKEFLNNHRIDITTFPSYPKVNELRLINNCIKHDGTVSNELNEANPTWINGSKLSDLDKHFHEFSLAAEFYMSSLTTELQKLLA